MEQAERLTIPLTGRAPVSISGESWPIIATYDSKGVGCALTVRQSAKDGRAIVYGHCDADGVRLRAGEYLGHPETTVADIVAALCRIAEALNLSAWVVESCIATLPAEELD